MRGQLREQVILTANEPHAPTSHERRVLQWIPEIRMSKQLMIFFRGNQCLKGEPLYLCQWFIMFARNQGYGVAARSQRSSQSHVWKDVAICANGNQDDVHVI